MKKIVIITMLTLSALIYFKFYNCVEENKIIFWDENFKMCCWGLKKDIACLADEPCVRSFKYRCKK